MRRDELPPEPEECACLAIRQAARRVTQFYDQYLAPAGLRTTQFSVLARLRQLGPMTINDLAARLVMDRTTLGRNILPLERDGLVRIVPGRSDRRRRELTLTEAGLERLRAAQGAWREAQAAFAGALGPVRAAGLRALLCDVAAAELPALDRQAPSQMQTEPDLQEE